MWLGTVTIIAYTYNLFMYPNGLDDLTEIETKFLGSRLIIQIKNYSEKSDYAPLMYV